MVEIVGLLYVEGYITQSFIDVRKSQNRTTKKNKVYSDM